MRTQKWQKANGKCKVGGGKWKMRNGKCEMENEPNENGIKTVQVFEEWKEREQEREANRDNMWRTCKVSFVLSVLFGLRAGTMPRGSLLQLHLQLPTYVNCPVTDSPFCHCLLGTFCVALTAWGRMPHAKCQHSLNGHKQLAQIVPQTTATTATAPGAAATTTTTTAVETT